MNVSMEMQWKTSAEGRVRLPGRRLANQYFMRNPAHDRVIYRAIEITSSQNVPIFVL